MRPITWCAAALVVFLPHSAVAEEWRGLVVAPEERCTPYNADEYSYPQSVEPQIADRLGGAYSPYTCETFGELTETDIEHIVARSEAHDSGLCLALPGTQAQICPRHSQSDAFGNPKVADFPCSPWGIVSKETHFDHRISSIEMPGQGGTIRFLQKGTTANNALHRMGTYLHILVCCRPCFKASRRFACTRTK